MVEDLPSEFDLIVIGTGLSESIVAAAGSRIGKTVLHVDSNEYYGGFWSSFNLENLQSYVEQCRKTRDPVEGESAVKECFLPLKKATFVEHVTEDWFDFETQQEVDGWNKETILKEFRRFNVDLAPKLMYSRGAMVELLISSNICRYAEFRAVDRVATIWGERIMTVPCSRSDVFTNRDVNVVEKRLLMKFLQSCASYETESDEHKAEDIEGITFLEYLKSHKLTPNLIHYLLYTIAMGNDRTSCRQGLEEVKKFLLSLGRYGNSPFLFPMYGCGEIPQCFCRLCAVFGGIYCLSMTINGVNFEQAADGGGLSFQSLNCGKQTIKAKHLVIGQGYAPEGVMVNRNSAERSEGKRKPCGKMSRGIFLTNVPLGGPSQNTGGGGVSFMKLPPAEGHEEGATIIQLAHNTGTCPKNIYIIHVTTKANSDDPKIDLEPYVIQILSREAPKSTASSSVAEEASESVVENNISTILYELYFTIPTCVACQWDSADTPKGISLACGPLHELDYDESIDRARQIFKDIYPEEEFLPRAPDPEEIVIGEETDQAQEIVAGADESEEVPEKVETARECRESETAPVATPPPAGISDAQEAREESVDNAEECVEQK